MPADEVIIPKIEDALELVKKQIHHISAFYHTKPANRYHMLKEASPALIRGLHGLVVATHQLTKRFKPEKNKQLLQKHGEHVRNIHESEDADTARKHILTAAKQTGGGFWDDIGDFFSDVGNGIADAATSAWDGVKSAASWVNDNVFTPVGNWAADVGNKIANDPLGALLNAGEAIGGLVTGDPLMGISGAAGLLT